MVIQLDGTHGDKHLVERLLQGEEAAFETFFAAYFPRLFRFALYRLGGDADQAEDVAQVTLIKALDKLASYRGEAALFTWLCTFCRHEISAQCRRRGSMPETVIEDEAALRAALESLTDLRDGPESVYARKELVRLIRVTLDTLPSAYGDALEWKYIDGVSVREIGERLGRSTKAAESLLTRAREAFRDGFATLSGKALPMLMERAP
jgi:RNA polymerase sigma-70 factor, ECF subfamily